MNPLATPTTIPAQRTPFRTALVPERFGRWRVLADDRFEAKTASRAFPVTFGFANPENESAAREPTNGRQPPETQSLRTANDVVEFIDIQMKKPGLQGRPGRIITGCLSAPLQSMTFTHRSNPPAREVKSLKSKLTWA